MADTLTDSLERGKVEAALAGGPTLFAPIRHHSPACAWHLRAMIRDHRPEVVLIEGPEDLTRHIPHLLESDAEFPLAIASLNAPDEHGIRNIRYFPFSDHAPETIAIREAHAIGAEVRFIDLPHHAWPDGKGESFQDETPFQSGEFIRAACKRLNLRDGDELWDHLFETRLGGDGWRAFFADTYAYCSALRDSTPLDEETLLREAHMRACLADVTGKRCVVVTGGFHTPALLSGNPPGKRAKAAPCESYLIAYGEDALDALSGYSAGLRYPGWYARAWSQANQDGQADWAALSLGEIMRFGQEQAAVGHRIALPQLSEFAALAQGLARFRGREAILLHDLFDGLKSALIKGEHGPGERWSEAFHHFLRGNALGRAPCVAGQPPLVHDARERAEKARFDLSNSMKVTRKLDFRRKEAHAKTSEFCHQMGILDTGFAGWITGPDLITGARAGLLFEEWDIAWSPFVEGRLIEASRLGATVPDAAANRLQKLRNKLKENGKTSDIPTLLDLLLTGLRAGLAPRITGLITEIRDITQVSHDTVGLAQLIHQLTHILTPGAALHDSRSDLLRPLATSAFDRFLLLIPDLAETPEDKLGEQISALSDVAAALQDAPDQASRFNAALSALTENPDTPALLRGAVMGLLTRSGLIPAADLARALRGDLGGVLRQPEDRAAFLDGLLRTAAMLLWQHSDILQAATEAIDSLDDDQFLTSLPALRRSLTQLNPHETSRLADELVEILGGTSHDLTRESSVTEDEAAQGRALDKTITQIAELDGLASWINAEAAP